MDEVDLWVDILRKVVFFGLFEKESEREKKIIQIEVLGLD